MPGILGIIRPQLFEQDVSSTLDRMAEPVRYESDQTVKHFRRDRFVGTVVDYGPSFDFLKPAAAERDGVLLLMEGEVFPDAGEVPHELQADNPTVQRAQYCLGLYLQEGPNFATRLNGTFAIAVYDNRDHTVHLYSDRFDRRLLFVSAKSEEAAFASSVRSLLRWRSDTGRKYDERSVVELILFERVLGDRTLFSDIRRLLPATHAVWTGGEWCFERYYEVHRQQPPDNCRSWKDGAGELLSCLRRSLEKRTADQGKVGLLLSGGLDSRLIMLACPKPPLTASFSTTDGALSLESKIAADVARAYGAEHIWLARDKDYYAGIAGDAIDINEGLSSAFIGCHSLGVHDLMVKAGIQVALTGDRFDVAYKDYRADINLNHTMYPTGPLELHARRHARILVESSLIRRADHQDLMMLALNTKMKEVAAFTKEQTVSELEKWCRQEIPSISGDIRDVVVSLALSGEFSGGFTSKGMLRGLSCRFLERSPFYDNDMLNLALGLPVSWALRGRLVRYAIKLACPRVARIRDVNTRLPAGLCPPWDRLAIGSREFLLEIGRRLSSHSRQVAKLRQAPPGTRVLPSRGWLFSHDAALAQCRPYRSLVEAAIEDLPEEFFDVATVKRLFEDDLASGAPRLSKLFEAIISFCGFNRNWGPNATRERSWL